MVRIAAGQEAWTGQCRPQGQSGTAQLAEEVVQGESDHHGH